MVNHPLPIVLDTCVVSLLFKGDEPVTYYRERIIGQRLLISFQTLEESWFGAVKNGWADKRRNALGHHLDQFEVVWPNPNMVRISANLRSEREKSGRRLNTADAWIAATAIMLQCPLASNDGDFGDIPNLQLIRAPS